VRIMTTSGSATSPRKLGGMRRARTTLVATQQPSESRVAPFQPPQTPGTRLSRSGRRTISRSCPKTSMSTTLPVSGPMSTSAAEPSSLPSASVSSGPVAGDCFAAAVEVGASAAALGFAAGLGCSGCVGAALGCSVAAAIVHSGAQRAREAGACVSLSAKTSPGLNLPGLHRLQNRVARAGNCTEHSPCCIPLRSGRRAPLVHGDEGAQRPRSPVLVRPASHLLASAGSAAPRSRQLPAGATAAFPAGGDPARPFAICESCVVRL
jgi:hypothetical protein